MMDGREITNGQEAESVGDPVWRSSVYGGILGDNKQSGGGVVRRILRHGYHLTDMKRLLSLALADPSRCPRFRGERTGTRLATRLWKTNWIMFVLSNDSKRGYAIRWFVDFVCCHVHTGSTTPHANREAYPPRVRWREGNPGARETNKKSMSCRYRGL